MADVVNLRTARKRRDREAKVADADRNRAAHGVSKADRRAARLECERGARALDAGRREHGD